MGVRTNADFSQVGVQTPTEANTLAKTYSVLLTRNLDSCLLQAWLGRSNMCNSKRVLDPPKFEFATHVLHKHSIPKHLNYRLQRIVNKQCRERRTCKSKHQTDLSFRQLQIYPSKEGA